MTRSRAPLVRVACALLALSLASCASVGETQRNNPKAVLGTVLGSGAGAGIAAIAGASPLGIVLSGVAGGLLGGYIGKRLDDRDKEMARQAANRAFEENRTGQPSVWNNPDSGNSGSVTPTRTYQANGQYCREYTQEIQIDGEAHQTHGTACRQPDGTWRIQS